VALARALAVEPKVLLLDEPFGALDARVRKDLRRWLRRFHDEIQLTTIFVTHDQEEALEIADEVVIMNQGRVEQVGTPQQVYDKPATPFVYQFLGNVNILRAPALAGAIRRDGRLAQDVPEGQIYVRPHDIELTPHDAGGMGSSAIVRHLHAAGPHARLLLEQVQTREQVEVEISRSELSDLNLRVNDLVRMRLRQAHSFDEDYAI
jgi:sulfate transport system ATP-binding protein